MLNLFYEMRLCSGSYALFLVEQEPLPLTLSKIKSLDRLVVDRRASRDLLDAERRLPPQQSAGAEAADTSVKAADSNVGSVRRSSSSALLKEEEKKENAPLPITTRHSFP